MTIKKLIKLLTYNECCYVNTWSIIQELVSIMPKCQITKKEWLGTNSYKNNIDYYNLDLFDIKTWSTYDKSCIDLRFTITSGNKLLCKAKIFNGDMVNGNRKSEKFYAELLVPMNFIKKLETNILNQSKVRLDYEYTKYLEDMKNEWINDVLEKILNE